MPTIQLVVSKVLSLPGGRDIAVTAHPVSQEHLPTSVTMPLAQYLMLGWREGDLIHLGVPRLNIRSRN